MRRDEFKQKAKDRLKLNTPVKTEEAEAAQKAADEAAAAQKAADEVQAAQKAAKEAAAAQKAADEAAAAQKAADEAAVEATETDAVDYDPVAFFAAKGYDPPEKLSFPRLKRAMADLGFSTVGIKSKTEFLERIACGPPGTLPPKNRGW